MDTSERKLKLVGYSFEMDSKDKLSEIFAVFAEKWQDPENLKQDSFLDAVKGINKEYRQLFINVNQMMLMVVSAEDFMAPDSSDIKVRVGKELLSDIGVQQIKKALEGVYEASTYLDRTRLANHRYFVPVTKLKQS